jgi:hypothetical protein
MRVLIVVLALTGLCSSQAGDQTSVFIDVPMRVHRGLPVIDVWINGSGPFRFGIDTGAMDSVVIGVPLAIKLGPARCGTMVERTAGAESRDRGRISIDSMRIGNAQFTNISAVLVDFGPAQVPFDGTLGLSLFKDFLTTIDYRKNRIRIDHAELPEADGKAVLPIEKHPTGLPFLKLNVQGYTLLALLDTGNLAAPFYLPGSLVNQLRWAGDSNPTKKVRTLGREMLLAKVTLAGVIRLGQYRFNQPVVV